MKFAQNIHPTRLFGPTRLIGTWEYLLTWCIKYVLFFVKKTISTVLSNKYIDISKHPYVHKAF